MKNEERAYFKVVGERPLAVWEDYRRRWLAHREALAAAADELGHPRIVEGFDGGIVAVARRDDGSLHPAFNPSKQARNGGHLRRQKGKTTEEKEAVQKLKEVNERLAALKPDPGSVAKAEGFLHHLSYTSEEGGSGWTTIGGHHYEWAQPLWAGMSQPIVLYVPDAAAAIERLKARPDVQSVDPESWAVPDGYERISKARYDLMVAQHQVELEERGDGQEG